MQKTYLSYQVFTKISPLMQALWVLGIGIAAMFIGGYWSEDQETVWAIGTMALGFYAWLNAVISFFVTKKWAKYFFTSLFFFLLLSLTIYFVGTFLSEINIFDIYEYRMMYAITIVFYILGSVVVSLMKNIAKALRINY